MKWAPVAEVVAINALLIPLLALITINYGLRLAYLRAEGFVPTMVRYPLFFITSAVKGSNCSGAMSCRIPGLLSIDWQQLILLLLVVTDAIFVWSALKSRDTRRSNEASQAQ